MTAALPWLKVLHLACVITFLAGVLSMLMLLHLRHGTTAPSLPQERRMLRAAARWNQRITGPALAGVWLFGIALAQQGGWFGMPWLNAKLVIVVAMSALHGVLSGWMRKATHGVPGSVFGAARWALPLLGAAVVAVVALAVVKPH